MAEEQLEEKVLLEWEAPERVFVKRDKKYFQNLFAVLLILAAVTVFFREFLLAALFGGFGFLQYALGTVPPGKARYRITNREFVIHGNAFPWEELNGFWFSEREGRTLLNIDTKKRFYPQRISLLLGDQSKEKVASILKRFIPLKKRPPEDFLDKASSKLSRYVHL
jgi:hypothetical protein